MPLKILWLMYGNLFSTRVNICEISRRPVKLLTYKQTRTYKLFNLYGKRLRNIEVMCSNFSVDAIWEAIVKSFCRLILHSNPIYYRALYFWLRSICHLGVRSMPSKPRLCFTDVLGNQNKPNMSTTEVGIFWVNLV